MRERGNGEGGRRRCAGAPTDQQITDDTNDMDKQERHPAIIEAGLTGIPQGQVVLFEQYGILRRTWWWVLLIAVAVTGAVWFYVSNYVPVEYMATTVTVPPRKTGTPLDNLLGDLSTGMKSLGLSRLIGKGAGSSGYSNMAILSSTPIKDSLIAKYKLDQVYDIPLSRRDLIYGKLEGNIEFDEDLEGPITISLYDTDPERAAAMANVMVNFTNAMLLDLNRKETEPISQFMERRFTQLQKEQEDLAKEMAAYMGRTSIYDPESQLPATATALIEMRAKESAQRSLVNVLQEILGDDDPGVQQQQQVLAQLERERQRMEGGGDGIGPSTGKLPAALMEYARLRQAYEVNAQTLLILEPMYQQTKFDEGRDIPALLFLSEATPPPVKARPRKGLILLSAFAGSIIVSYIVIALLAYFRSFSFRYRQYKRVVEGDKRLPVRETDPS